MQWDLRQTFDSINEEHFGGILPEPYLRWNSRLRTSAGRFFPGRRERIGGRLALSDRPIIEVATYLREEGEAEKLIWDTVAHEMIHYWLWHRRRPYGHTGEFLSKMRAMGVSRYNPVPRHRPYKHVYGCGHCGEEYPSKRKLSRVACRSCCDKHNGGYYHRSYALKYLRAYSSEGPGPSPSQDVQA